MDYRGLFEDAGDALRQEKRYRVFADLERVAGSFPRALYRDEAGNAREITVWCSNDYLGMGQHPKVVAAMQETAARFGVDLGSRWRPLRLPDGVDLNDLGLRPHGRDWFFRLLSAARIGARSEVSDDTPW